MRDPIEVAVMALMAVQAWSGAYVPALILFGALVATLVYRALTTRRLETCCMDSNPNVFGVCRNCGRYAYGGRV